MLYKKSYHRCCDSHKRTFVLNSTALKLKLLKKKYFIFRTNRELRDRVTIWMEDADNDMVNGLKDAGRQGELRDLNGNND